MAIRTENFTIVDPVTGDEREFVRTWSSTGHYVMRDGVAYSEACDPADSDRVYTEGDLMPGSNGAGEEALEILNIILGGSD